MIDIACGRDDNSVRGVESFDMAGDGLLVDCSHTLVGAEDRHADRMIRPEKPIEKDMDLFVRSILQHVDLLQDDLSFATHVGGIEKRIEKDIGKNLR